MDLLEDVKKAALIERAAGWENPRRNVRGNPYHLILPKSNRRHKVACF